MVEKYARFVAPLALAAVSVGVYVIIHDNLTHHPAKPTVSRPALVTTRHTARRARPTPRYYIVRSGDTLSQIASRTGVPVTQLTALNPALATAPDSLQTGQRLRLRR